MIKILELNFIFEVHFVSFLAKAPVCSIKFTIFLYLENTDNLAQNKNYMMINL